ncbi:hypothetical protein [Halalkalibacillus halophilus]|uniref:hypothetical protein n=1 Tax=Halalkalibacillus halophilus TaxID=392827 RepID=UPI0004006EA5|nr:hypothetical protein [Halalkalibacillus halophilus]
MKKHTLGPIYLTIVIIMSVMVIAINVIDIMIGQFPDPTGLMLLSFAFTTWTIYFLYPQFRQDEERASLIRRNGGILSVVLFVIHFILTLFIIRFPDLGLATTEIVYYAFASLNATVCFAFIFVSKSID